MLIGNSNNLSIVKDSAGADKVKDIDDSLKSKDDSRKSPEYPPDKETGDRNIYNVVRTLSSDNDPKKNNSEDPNNNRTTPTDVKKITSVEKKILPPTQKRIRHSILKRIEDVNRGKFEAIVKDPELVKSLIDKKLPINFAPDLENLAKVLAPGKNHDRIRKAFELCIKYDGDIVKAAHDAGYPYATTANKFMPSRLIKSNTWQALIKYYFPVYLLFEKNRELLEHKDWRAVNASLDRIHKLRGDFVQKVDIHVSAETDLSTKSDQELNKIIEGEYEDVESNISGGDINSDNAGSDNSRGGGESGEENTNPSPI